MANEESRSREARANAPTERSGGFERGDVEATLPTRDLDGADADELDEERDAALLRAIAYAPPRRPPSAVAPGSTWGADGRYIIERRLGRGGMGTVYAATDSLIRRSVALKVLDVADPDPVHHARLMREAQTAARVEHERIARVYDVGSHDGFPFVAMEYVHGGTLRQWMAKGGKPLAQILDVATQIAEGLAELHAEGVVHRDLKPENVMRNAQGGIKLVDFGLARHGAGEPSLPLGGRSAAVDGSSTAASSGTPGYMAPEQCTGQPIDARADIFALGVILYELIAETKPFRGTTVGAIVDATLEGVPIPDDGIWAHVPARLRAHVAQMLAPAPEARFANGAEALAALREVTPGISSPSMPPVQAQRLGRAPTARPAKLRAASFLDVGVSRGLELPVALTGVIVLALAAFLPGRSTPTPPAGMALIDVGTIDVGRTPFELEAECREIGPRCDRADLYRETPRVTVKIAPFLIDRDEVTTEQLVEMLNLYRGSLTVFDDEETHYPRFVRRNAGTGEDTLLDLSPRVGGIDYIDHVFVVRAGHAKLPAVQVTLYGAELYCALKGKRLPTENEWEAAARGRGDRSFPWGAVPPRCGEVAVPKDRWIPGMASCPGPGAPQTVSAMMQDVTPEGVHDLGGNVTEWTSTRFVEGNRGGYVTTGPRDAPRVVRGGSWYASMMARTSGRDRVPPVIMAPNLGFRCASDLADASP
jgi:formylglycine-generating enzyme required for sulfatase activity/predicted Ser/Thr protein kinase